MNEASTIQVAILYPADGYNWQRQIPPGGFCGVNFVLNRPEAEADWLFVYEGLSGSVSSTVPKPRRVFVCGEPASTKRYPKGFLAQFGVIWTTDPYMDHPGAILHHPCCPWHVGAYANPLRDDAPSMDVTDLLQVRPEKSKLIAVVSSNKSGTEGHRKRLAFVEALKRELGGGIDVFGRGLRGFEDKWDVLADVSAS